MEQYIDAPNTGKSLDPAIYPEEAPVDFVSFSGGGAKGAIYSGVYAALKEDGKLDPVKAVAGSSAGAITAALVATGMPPEEFEELSRSTNFQKLLNSGGKKPILNDGKPLYDMIQDNIEKNIAHVFEEDIDALCTRRIAEVEAESQKVEAEIQKIESEREILESDQAALLEDLEITTSKKERKAIKKQLNNYMDNLEALAEAEKFVKYKQDSLVTQKITLEDISQDKSPEFKKLQQKNRDIKIRRRIEAAEGFKRSSPPEEQILFKDLSILRALDPVRFKDLIVTAVNKDTGELEIFSPSTSPNVEIALACRASASIPLVFKPVEINGKTYVDGGYRDNIPTKYFKGEGPEVHKVKGRINKKKSKTLAFAFGSDSMDSPVNRAIYGSSEKITKPSRIIQFLSNVLFKSLARVGGKFKYTESEENTYKELRGNALNVVPLDTKSVGTLSFDEATKRARFLHAKGYIDTKIHMKNHDPASTRDPELEAKSFLIELGGRIDKTGWKSTFKGKVESGVNNDTVELITDICQPSYKIEDIKSDFVKIIKSAAELPVIDQLSAETRGIEKLIKSLNGPTATLEIKKTFMDVLGIDIYTDKRIANRDEKATQKALAMFKFTKEDFKTVVKSLDRSQETKSHSRMKSKPSSLR